MRNLNFLFGEHAFLPDFRLTRRSAGAREKKFGNTEGEVDMTTKKFLIFGAHPDDPDLMFGGCATRLAKAGHTVKFVSLTDGGAGHHKMPPEQLIPRRCREAQNAARISGVSEYQILNHPDGRLENTIAIREELTGIIREFEADVVISHRLCDYHPDHRNTAQLVMDTAFLVKVPHFCPAVPVPAGNPVYACSMDFFTDPRPFRIDAAVNIDATVEEKFKMLDCHVSQFYEWLPWVDFDRPDFDVTPMTWPERKEWLNRNWMSRFNRAAQLAGLTEAAYAECFELSPYGSRVSPAEFQAILNGC